MMITNFGETCFLPFRDETSHIKSMQQKDSVISSAIGEMKNSGFVSEG